MGGNLSHVAKSKKPTQASNKAAGISRNGPHRCPSEKDETTESEDVSGC